MKRTIIYILTIPLIIILVILIVKFLNENDLKKIGFNLELDVTSCNLETFKDTHSGFLGDGDYFARIKCSNINYNELSSNWKKLPLDDAINKVLSMKFCDGDECKDIYEKYLIPDIVNGYYYFYDRHSDSKDKYDTKELNNRSSWNFTLGIIDLDTNIVYYYKLDT